MPGTGGRSLYAGMEIPATVQVDLGGSDVGSSMMKDEF
jgi:hypothetical protein